MWAIFPTHTDESELKSITGGDVNGGTEEDHSEQSVEEINKFRLSKRPSVTMLLIIDLVFTLDRVQSVRD